ncbi:MAG: hypothetical protein V8S99_08450 [Oscillospiraceae bacterium]
MSRPHPQSVRLFRRLALLRSKGGAAPDHAGDGSYGHTVFELYLQNMAYEAMLPVPCGTGSTQIWATSAPWRENDVDFEFRGGIDSIVAVHLKDTLAVTFSVSGKIQVCTLWGGLRGFSAPLCRAGAARIWAVHDRNVVRRWFTG